MAVDLVLENRILTLTINRPDKRNALRRDVVESLTSALRRAETDAAVRVVVLTGAGKVFSAGADLSSLETLQTASAMDNLADSTALAELFEAIYLLKKPVIAKINGHAIAGGCGLASVCDISIASSAARLGFTEVRIGFIPAIVMVFVVRKIGETAARNLFLRGHLVSGDEAARMGLITESVEPALLDETVDRIAAEVAGQTSESAIGLTKSMLARIPGMGLAEALGYAAHMNALARGTEDCKAGIAAFLNKTDPPWKS